MDQNNQVARKEKTVVDLIQGMQKQFENALPKALPIERFMRIALTQLRLKPKLQECTQASLLGALMQAAQEGLEPGIDGQCHLIPRWNGKAKVMEVNYQRGYQGVLQLARRSGEYSLLTIHDVYENDEFDYSEGSENYIKFKRTLKKRGDLICFFAMTKLKHGETAFTIMSVDEIEVHRDKFAATKDQQGNVYGVWKDDFIAMGKKTVLIQHLKYQPKSIEVSERLATDELTVNYDSGMLLPQSPYEHSEPPGPKIPEQNSAPNRDPEPKKENPLLKEWDNLVSSMTEEQFNKFELDCPCPMEFKNISEVDQPSRLNELKGFLKK